MNQTTQTEMNDVLVRVRTISSDFAAKARPAPWRILANRKFKRRNALFDRLIAILPQLAGQNISLTRDLTILLAERITNGQSSIADLETSLREIYLLLPVRAGSGQRFVLAGYVGGLALTSVFMFATILFLEKMHPFGLIDLFTSNWFCGGLGGLLGSFMAVHRLLGTPAGHDGDPHSFWPNAFRPTAAALAGMTPVLLSQAGLLPLNPSPEHTLAFFGALGVIVGFSEEKLGSLLARAGDTAMGVSSSPKVSAPASALLHSPTPLGVAGGHVVSPSHPQSKV